ncbi:MAG TPA: hypothetical protein GXX51_04940 [Firmicutes bacterium]|nr:hypothetical protein [Bacillota bacterium]
MDSFGSVILVGVLIIMSLIWLTFIMPYAESKKSEELDAEEKDISRQYEAKVTQREIEFAGVPNALDWSMQICQDCGFVNICRTGTCLRCGGTLTT